MKKLTFFACLVCMVFSATSQKKTKPEEAFYVLDKNFQGTTVENGVYLMHSLKKSDSSWLFDTYNMYGPLVASELFKDDKATVLNGRSVYFNKKGTRDSICNFIDGIPNGTFYYFNDTNRVYLEKVFRNGMLTETIDRIQKDSIDEAERKRKNDTTDKVEIESEFPGGTKAWIKYLNNHLVYPDRAQKTMNQGTVAIQFIVDTEGHVSGEEIVQSVEYSLDREAMRMITESPAWIPAFQNGKKVKSYKKQPITYRLQ